MAFQIEKETFAPSLATIATQCSVGTDNSVAWDYDRYSVVAISATNRAKGLRIIDGTCDVLVAASFAIGNTLEFLPNLTLKVRTGNDERDVKVNPLTREVLVEFMLHPVNVSVFAWCNDTMYFFTQAIDPGLELRMFSELEQA